MNKKQELRQWFDENREKMKAAGVIDFDASHHGEGDEGDFDTIDFNMAEGSSDVFEIEDHESQLIEDAVQELAGGSFSVDGYPGAGGRLVGNVETGSLVYTGYTEVIEEAEDAPVEL